VLIDGEVGWGLREDEKRELVVGRLGKFMRRWEVPRWKSGALALMWEDGGLKVL